MADLHKFTVQESLNASQGHAGGWSVQSKIIFNTPGSPTSHHALNSSTTILLLQPTSDMKISFTVAEADISADDDIYIPGDVLTSLVVPRNLGGTINMNILGNSTSGTLRFVEV